MATDIERLVAVLEARTTAFEKAMNRAVGISNQRARQIETRFAKMNRTLSSSFSQLGRGMAASLAGAVSIRGAQQLIDSATRIENALKVAGLAGDELSKVYDRLFDSAQRNAAPIEAMVTLYGQLAQAQDSLKVSQDEMTNFVDKIGVALRVSGASAEQASGALLQLSQALGSGIVRAEEYNSINEGARPILQAVAAGLREAAGDVAKLRSLVMDGKVSSEAFFRAFEAGSVILQEKVAGAEFTVSNAFTRLQNTLVHAAGRFDEVTGAGAETVRGLDRLAGIINGLSNVFEAAANGPIGNFIEKLSQLNELIKAVLPGISAFGLLDEKVLNDVAGFIGPSQGPSSVPVNRAGKGGRVVKDPIQSRIDAAFGTAGVTPVSLENFAVPEKEKKGRGGRGPREDDLAREIRQIQERTAAIQAETVALASVNPLMEDYGYTVDKARAKQELLTAAKKAGIAITPELEQRIDALAEGYARASSEAQRLAEEQDKVRESAEEFRALGKDVLGGFIKDLTAGKSAAEALEGALGKVADKLLDIALNSLFDGISFGGLFGLGGGGGGISWANDLFRASGGPVRKGQPYIVGEKRPELFVPDQNGTIIPRVPQISSSRGGGGSPQPMVIRVEVSGARGNTEIETMVERGVQQGLQAYDRSLPARVHQISSDPRRR